MQNRLESSVSVWGINHNLSFDFLLLSYKIMIAFLKEMCYHKLFVPIIVISSQKMNIIA